MILTIGDCWQSMEDLIVVRPDGLEDRKVHTYKHIPPAIRRISSILLVLQSTDTNHNNFCLDRSAQQKRRVLSVTLERSS